ncbi:hypothetical protein [Halapricum salinum]|uniref:Uncharacterized protein n=1 Tax=Halapricum salinum TaxID=1457250 RepID=A0A4D6H827_9EURY|nr:hypothetical protein [Halapricum salinum]QCC49775.1 hypothetical protein DV733_00390 [Halapricum salinum]
MADKRLTRRTLLQRGAGAAGFVTLGSLAGCGSDGGGNGNGNGNGNAPGSGQIPAAAQAMVQVDAQGMLNDDNIRSVVNTFLEEAAAQGGYTGPQTMEEVLSRAESESELSPQGFNSMTMFMKVEGQNAVENYLGMLFETDWTAQEMIDAAGGLGADVTEGTYQGVTTYTTTDATGETTMAADLGDGMFALGTENAARDAIDVSTGNGDAVSGNLANYFDQTSGGYMRFTSMIPEDQIPDDSGQMDVGFQQIRYVSGSFYSQGSNLGVDLNLHTTGSEAASELSTNLDAALNFLSSGYDDPTAQEIIDQIEFSTSGPTVTITYAESVSKINTYVEAYAASVFTGGMGGGGFGTANASASA